jgi:hypothetical protein
VNRWKGHCMAWYWCWFVDFAKLSRLASDL